MFLCSGATCELEANQDVDKRACLLKENSPKSTKLLDFSAGVIQEDRATRDGDDKTVDLRGALAFRRRILKFLNGNNIWSNAYPR